LNTPQPPSQSPPILPERPPLQEAAALTTPHRRNKHKNRSTPRGTGSPTQESTPENPLAATPRSSHAKCSHSKGSTRKHSKRKNRSKQRGEAQTAREGDSFRRSGSTQSLEEVVSSSIPLEDEESGEDSSVAASPSVTVQSAHERSGTSSPTVTIQVNSPFRKRGSSHGTKVRKSSLSFSGSNSPPESILSISSSGDSTPLVSVTNTESVV